MIHVVFIAGSGRSGSTLIDRLLGRAGGAFSAGELQYVWARGFARHERCGCGADFDACSVWNAIGASLGPLTADAPTLARLVEDRRVLVSPTASLRGDRATREQRFLEALGRLYAAIQEETGATTLIDSSKNPLYGELLTRVPGVAVDVVHVVRDPRAVAYSWASKKERQQPGERYMVRHGAVGSTARWVAHNALAERLGRHARSYQRLIYERFAERPQAELDRIAEAVGLDLPGDLVVDGVVELPVDHTCAGNPSRFAVGAVPIRPDERWRSGTAGATKAVVAGLSWPLMLRYGYR